MSQVIVSPETKSSGKLRIVTGEVALDGANPTVVNLAGKLRSVVACALSLKGSAAPGLSTSTLSYSASGSTLNIYAWKPTGAGDTTLVASGGTQTVTYVAVGY